MPEFLPKYPSPKIRNVEESEISRLFQIFWGKTPKTSQENPCIAQENPDRVDEEEEQKKDGSKKYFVLSSKEQRIDFLNKNRSAIQRCMLVTQFGRNPTVYSFVHPNFCAIDVKLTFYDKVRVCIFTKMFGINFDFSKPYPHMNRRRILKFIKNVSKNDTNQTLDELGINSALIQDIIRKKLNNEVPMTE